MSDKRQRARVQGCWAKQLPKHSGPTGKSKCCVYCEMQDLHAFKTRVKYILYTLTLCLWGFSLCLFVFHLSRLRLLPGFLSLEEANWMFSKLLAELPWSQKTNYRQGEAYEEPRLTCWYGELPYTYARSTMAANMQWHPLLVNLCKAVEHATGCSFNSLLCNLYRDGHDSIGWHSDDEASLGQKPTIASLSLGDTRVFSLRKQPPPEEKGDYTYMERIRIPLSHGTLLLMEGATQDDWQHQVAKEYHDRGPRINLTFRTIYPEPEGQRAGTKMRFTAK
uniref:Alpha-ketoglutarate-dependent dioxygenase alkB homolog 3 n=1 Tax=Neolamprologus brichardi TaxID=32507 RepID=A0A3Q4HGY8_NEOBR